MGLSNSQYDRLMREYDEQQNNRRRLVQDRLSLIRKKIPKYGEIEDSISSLCVSRAFKAINGESNDTTSLRARLREYEDEKISLLKSSGFPKDYLNPPYNCPDCQDTGYTGNKKCHCFRQKISALLYEQSNLGRSLNEENFSTLSYKYYTGDALNSYKNTVSAAHDFINAFPSGQNLLFYGNVGSGKTFLSKCITKELIDKGCFVLYFSAATLVELLIGKNADYELDAREDIYECDLLIIDDLGTEYPNDYVVSRLYSCINRRLLDKKSTIISTNLSLSDLKDIYSDRIFSRIASMYEMHKITCPDIRIQKSS